MDRVLLYEWAAAGGLDGPDAVAVGCEPRLADTIRTEGRAMLAALVADALLSTTLTATTILADDDPLELPSGVAVRRVPPGAEVELLLEEARRADWTIVVAPETAGILAQRISLLDRADCRRAGPSPSFVDVAADKQATAIALAAAGVPVPAGRALAAGETPPDDFRRPLIRKARDSAGCDGVEIVHDHQTRSASIAERIEAFVDGTPVGVSVLCGPGRLLPLPPVRQRIEWMASPRYHGGSFPIETCAATRAQRLAVRAITAVEAACRRQTGLDFHAAGWVGVDMILGRRDDGRCDRVLEINPRVTTSLVGLASIAKHSLVEATIAAASGCAPSVSFRDLAPDAVIYFHSAGSVDVR